MSTEDILNERENSLCDGDTIRFAGDVPFQSFNVRSDHAKNPLQINAPKEGKAFLQLGNLRISSDDFRDLAVHFIHLANILECKNER